MNLPIDWGRKPTPEEVDELLELIADPATPDERMQSAKRLLAFHGLLPDELRDEDEDSEPDTEQRREAPSQGNPVPYRPRAKLHDGQPDYTLPHNLDAECKLLVRLAYDVEFRNRCGDLLTREDFFLEPHRLLFDAMLSIHRTGKAIDRASLTAELAPEALKEIGETLLSQVAEPKLKLDGRDDLIQMVAEDSARRRYIMGARRIEDGLITRRLATTDASTQARALIESLSNPGMAVGWEPPLLDGMIPPEPFPLEVLPKPLAELAKFARDVMFVPPDYILGPCLAIAGAAMGRSVALHVKEGWVEYGALQTIIVGSPGTAKSPALNLAASPIWELFRELQEEHALLADAYREARYAYEQERKKPGCNAPPFDGLAPVLRRIAVSDTTVESLAQRLWENPRGLIMIQDEYSAWMAGMNQYKGGDGNDKHFYLQTYSFSPIPIDRKGQIDGPMFIKSPFLAITGGIQPDILPAMDPGRGKRDGFIDRFLFSYPEELVRDWSNASIPAGLRDAWREAVRRLWNRPMITGTDGEDYPARVRFNVDAEAAFASWYRGMCKEMQGPHFNADFKGAWSKFLTYGARLSLVLEQLHWAFDPKTKDAVRNVRASSVHGAIKLVEYYKNHFRRVYVTIRGVHNDNKLARDIVAWAVNTGRRTIKESDAKDNFKRSLQDQPPETLREAFQWLVQRHVLRRAAPSVRRPGRKPLDLYEVNPLIFEKRPLNSEGE